MLTKSTDPYFNYVSQVWTKFDKIPHQGYSNNTDYDYFKKLKEDVVIPLGLNPDEYKAQLIRLYPLEVVVED